MKAEILTWSQVAKMPHEGRVFLHDGGLVTIRKIGDNISTMPGNPPKFFVDFRTPWGNFRSLLVRGEFMVAILEGEPAVLDSGSQDQEGN